MQKKTLWFAAYIALLAASSAAQTNTFPTSGNVGIGTTNPSQQLQITGNMLLPAVNSNLNGNLFFGGDTSAGVGGMRLWSDGNQGTIDVRGATGLAFRVDNSNGATGRMMIGSNGNVGIGTTAPLSALTLAGSNAVNPNPGPQVDYVGEDLSFENLVVAKAIGDIKMVQPTGYYVDAGDMVFSTSYGGLSEKMRVTALGNVGIGSVSPGARLEVNGNVKLSSGSGASISFADNTVQSTAWTGTLCGGDYAESVDVSGERTQYEPGDVLVVDSNNPSHFLKANEPYSTLVAGIYSTKPGVLGRRQTTDPKTSTAEVPMAMVGIVPTKVSAENGAIKSGDLLVASSTPGHAMKGTDRSLLTGAIVGKALESLASGTGVIEVLVSLQ